MKTLLIIISGILTIFFPLLIWILYRIIDAQIHVSTGEEIVFNIVGFIGTFILISLTAYLIEKD